MLMGPGGRGADSLKKGVWEKGWELWLKEGAGGGVCWQDGGAELLGKRVGKGVGTE